MRKCGLSLHLHIFLGHVISLATADNRCNQFGPRSGSTEKKVDFEKKPVFAEKLEKLL